MTDHILRTLLTGQAVACLVLFGHYVGSTWAERTRPMRTVMLGVALVMCYVISGQAKAFMLNIPFDGFSWFGVFAYSVLIAGFVWHIAREQGRKR